MKNRKVLSHENLAFISSDSISTSNTRSENQTGKRISSGNIFFKKTSEILQNYKVLFNRPTGLQFGDAETNFKQSLRHYNDFELPIVKLKTNKRKEHKTKKIKNGLLLAQGDTNFKHTLPLKSEDNKKDKLYSKSSVFLSDDIVPISVDESQEEDTEPDIFYSPVSEDLDAKELRSFLELEFNLEFEQEEETQKQYCQKQPTEEKIQIEIKESHNIEKENLVTADVVGQSKEKLETLETNTELIEIVPEDIMAEDEDLDEVEKLVERAGSALEDVVLENPSLQNAIDKARYTDTEETDYAETVLETTEPTTLYKGDTSEATDASGKGTDSEDDGTAKRKGGLMEVEVLRELEEAEQQAKATAVIIYELKERVSHLLSKQKMTEEEAKELELNNKQLRDQMALFEEKTKRIQFLVNKASLFDNMIPPTQTISQVPHSEDMLPKVIICGITENNMPKIIVCDDHKKKPLSRRKASLPPQPSVMPQFAKRLSESYSMQEKLAAENADLEGKRYQLQEDLIDKDQTVESLQRKLSSLQGELRMVCKENCLLTEKLTKIESGDAEPCCSANKGDSRDLEAHLQKYHNKQKQKMPCGKGKGPCPSDVESRLQEYSDTTNQLEKQLTSMECEMRNMQCELVNIQKERQHLEQHRRMLSQGSCPPPPCGPVPCVPPPCPPPPCGKPPCQGPCNPNNKNGGGNPQQQLSQLREQYNRLQDDYKSKLTEVAGLRADVEKLKQSAKDAEDAKKAIEDKLKEYEREIKGHKQEKNKFLGSKEQLIEQEQQLNVAKQRFREAQDELEELRALIEDQQAQLDDYRNKYLQAQQQVEEQRRQIDMMEMENNRISEQVNLEIQRVKNQFQEKLQELTPLPDILKTTQLKLQEAQQMHLLAEKNNESLVHELQAYRDKAAAMANQIEQVRSDQQLGADEKATMAQKVEELQQKLNETVDENDQLRTEYAKMEEVAEHNEQRVQEKLHEIAQLVSQLETVREESARQVARTKDRCETVRRSMQNQIADLERQLAQSRAQARSAQKDRDDIRQKMQSQINNLNENFEDAQMRIRNLQGHVNFLKNSYTTVFPHNEPLGDGMDACDCGNNF